ncbi:peptidyl-prolyl cis-trans isomerase-like 4 [Dermatophagoides farinae]|uniref:peptidyl-prolyl cis-trans isomerase-like 4 n=1 Tax=Dermatophagoides farinae TaxID=6954 RepID=UPI003F62A1C4
MSVVIETTIGDITVDLYIEQRPMTSKNFLKLCQMKYYNNCAFHFVQRDFIAQTGDPSGTGTGGQSVYSLVSGSDQQSRFIEAEKKPKLKHDRLGLISMVNNGENLHGSQFFFTLCDSLNYLDNVHTVFGEITEGNDVLVKLNDTICDDNHRPYQDIMITHTVILDDPFPGIAGLNIPSESPRTNLEELINSDRIGICEEVVEDGKTTEEVEEELRDKEAKQRALVLEMIGDIPDADIKPPENVLFVCKLNPVTREEDLEIIFSRFGKILSCEIIKDQKTDESLQYGFIEFDRKEDCEKAYFKMDNVLIDDRRIHVDFSQSVSKIKWRGKGRGVTFIDDEENHCQSRNQAKSLQYVHSLTSKNDKRSHQNYQSRYKEPINDKRNQRDHREDSRKRRRDDHHRDSMRDSKNVRKHSSGQHRYYRDYDDDDDYRKRCHHHRS